MAKARQRFLASLHGLNECGDVLGTAMSGWLVRLSLRRENDADLPIEMSIRMTASFAPPCSGPLRRAVRPAVAHVRSKAY